MSGPPYTDTAEPEKMITSVVQSRPFDLLVVHFWSIFSHGPKRLTFWFQVLWAIELQIARNEYC